MLLWYFRAWQIIFLSFEMYFVIISSENKIMWKLLNHSLAPKKLKEEKNKKFVLDVFHFSTF